MRVFTVLVVLVISLVAQQAPPPLAPIAHFHHLHLNSTDPAAALDFYPAKFNAEKAKFLGALDGVWTQKSWIFVSKVAAPPPSAIESAIWHFGWGAEDMKATYQKQLDMGTKFDTPIVELFPNFFYAYVAGPDGALIELNTARHHDFGHLHLLSENPVAAGEWYAKHFGATIRSVQKEPRYIRDHPVAPSSSLMMDNVNIIIYPVEYARFVWKDHWKPGVKIAPTKGRVVDHIGFSVDNLDETLTRLKAAGVKVTDEPRVVFGGKLKFAFIEGPDNIRIEVVEGHAKKE